MCAHSCAFILSGDTNNPNSNADHSYYTPTPTTDNNNKINGVVILGHAMMCDSRTLVCDARKSLCSVLCEHGFIVVLPDQRGHGNICM